MGCPSNVRLYTSYYNNFIMSQKKNEKTMGEKLMSPLFISHFVTLTVHAVSAVYSGMLMDKVTDAQKYSLTEIKELRTPVANSSDIITYPVQAVTEGTFYNINPMTQILIMNIIVMVTMLMHIARTFNTSVRDSVTYKGNWGYVLQTLHIASYGYSHFLAIFLVYLIAGYRDTLSMLQIFVSVIGLEALQHFSANPNPPDLKLKDLSRIFIGVFAGAPTLVVAIMIAVAIGNRDLPNGGWGLLALIVLEGLKFAVQTLPFIRDLVGDARVAHAYHDALIKVFLVWFLLLQSLQQQDGIDGKADLSEPYTAVGYTGVGIFALYFIYAGMAYNNIFFTKSLDEKKLEEERRNFPSATMEEKTRMLQVA